MSIALDNFETRLLTRPQAAAWLRERYHVGSKSWLAALSVKGQGPSFVIVGKQALYRPQDLAHWIEQRFFSEKPSSSSSVDEPKVADHSFGIDTDAIEQGLRLVAQLGA